MTEQKFDPVKEFVNLRDNLSKTVGEGLKNIAGINPMYPAVDVYETEGEVVVVTAPISGAVADSFEVSMEDDILTITGRSEDDREIDDEAFLQREVQFGEFRRQVRIGRPVNPSEARASFKNASLTVKIPKRNQPASQIIDVTPAE